MGHRHFTRREILNSIPVLASAGPLLPFGTAREGTRMPGPVGILRGMVRDEDTGLQTAAKMRIVDEASGQVYMPSECIRTMPAKSTTNVRYFYIRGPYELALPIGRYRIEVVRGICHQPQTISLDVGEGVCVRDFRLKRLTDRCGWYSGNTHTHYNLDIEEEVDERLRLVTPAEGVDVSVISYLIRNNLPYPSNRIPIGRLTDFFRDGAILDMGEECRNNFVSRERPYNVGYGHCLFLNIPRLIEPVSTGQLSADANAPDFPTLSMLCTEARRLGGTTIWCHNGHGMETPVAVALGQVDALNIADGFPVEYDWYYRLLNCGFRLPISSGTDWWEYDHNRVFVRVEGEFNYENWLAGLRAGRTFVSNGPLIELTVNGQSPGSVLQGVRHLEVTARAVSRVPFERLEVVHDGDVVAQKTAANGQEAKLEWEFSTERSGWVAARVAGNTETRRGYPVFAHTNPVYLQAKQPQRKRQEAARAWTAEIEDSMRFIRKYYRFAYEADKALALGRFEEGRRFYANLATHRF
jgi:hypothetical protein